MPAARFFLLELVLRSICRYKKFSWVYAASSILLGIFLVHVFLVTVDSAVVGFNDCVESVVCMHARICSSKTVGKAVVNIKTSLAHFLFSHQRKQKNIRGVAGIDKPAVIFVSPPSWKHTLARPSHATSNHISPRGDACQLRVSLHSLQMDFMHTSCLASSVAHIHSQDSWLPTASLYNRADIESNSTSLDRPCWRNLERNVACVQQSSIYVTGSWALMLLEIMCRMAIKQYAQQS